MKQLWIAVLALTVLMPFSQANAIWDTAKASEVANEVSGVSGVSATKLLHLGAMFSQIGSGTTELGDLLEKEDVEGVREMARDLHSDVNSFSREFKGLVSEEYHGQITNVTNMISGNLKDIDKFATDDNIKKAREEYTNLMSNWDNMNGYYYDRFGEVIGDKEQVRGWMNWALDSAYNWWFGGE